LSALFTIYRSSAGSGKTRTLAKEYLKLALQSRAGYFRHILGVTFANKSTQEMKDRILAYLNDFSQGKQNDLSRELQEELRLDPQTFQNYADEVRSQVLHNYSQFSISTIDAFFQRVIRSFTREAGLAGDYRLEVENDPIMEEVVDNLIDELGSNELLTDWVVKFANQELENERAWDVRRSLLEFSKQIFRDEFKDIETELSRSTSNPDFFKNLLKELNKEKHSFLSTIKSKANEAVTLIRNNQYDFDDFKYAGGGAFSYLIKIAKIEDVDDFNEKEKGKRAEGDYQQSINWPAKDSPHHAAIKKLAEERLIPLLNEILEFREKHYQSALSAQVVLSNFYSFGLIADISRKLKEYKDENSIMLLADAAHFLNGVIRDSDTPFIYEKVGSFYKNFLIDEFQDTSRMQWQNFFPLLTNALDQGDRSLIVGDVKQAIYRWRGGDLSLLQQEVEAAIGAGRVDSKFLNSNYRSAKAVVEFNNAVFTDAAAAVSAQTGHALPSLAYEDISQQVSKDEEGFVEIAFVEETDDQKWNEVAMDRIPVLLEKFQRLGARLKDIAILVRRNSEGQEIVANLLKYKTSEKAQPDCKYDVVSNESLRLDGAASVNLLVSALKYLNNTEDAIARAQLSYEYSRLHHKLTDLSEVFAVTNRATFENHLPESFSRQKLFLKKLPLFEMTESLVQIFELGKCDGELSYLQTFQDLVLEFSSRERNDLASFLLWWEENKDKKSIQVSGEVDAAQIFRVHRSKGLQFNYVIIPFCAWELDHGALKAPTLWVKADEPTFKEAGYLPVKYSGTLKETLFASYYEEEKARCFLDNLNLLYVALTRAKHGLMVMAPSPNNKRSYTGKVSELLFNAMQRSLTAGWNLQQDTWTSGEWSLKSEKDKTEIGSHPVQLKNYETSPWRNKLVIKQSSKGHFETSENRVAEKVKYGIHLHTVLSRIKYRDELDDAILNMEKEGIITDEERPVIHTLITELLGNEVVANWFSNTWEVRTEVPILLPGEGDNRIDRLLTNDKKAVVVDFKTGEPARADQQQVVSYMDTLRKMNFADVEGYLLYIKTGEVVSVPAGKKSKVKGVDGQLGLGI
jgi:ATP-dependent exoDNAse (exonuclease V) beta subunit